MGGARLQRPKGPFCLDYQGFLLLNGDGKQRDRPLAPPDMTFERSKTSLPPLRPFFCLWTLYSFIR